MTALAGGSAPPAARFGEIGSKVSGIIEDFQDVPVTDFQTKQARTWPDGNPMIQTRISLRQDDGTLVSLYVKPGRMRTAIREALKAAGEDDIEQEARLTVTFTGYEQGKGAQPAKTYSAEYAGFDGPPF